MAHLSKTLMQHLKKLLGTNKQTTESLEKDLTPLDQIEQEDVANPYGRHVCTVTSDVFSKGTYVTVSKGDKVHMSKFIPDEELIKNVEEVERTE